MRWVVAGGGTGGHLFPGIAVAEAFLEREKGNEVLFIGTERGIEARVLADGRFPLRTIQAMPILGKTILGKTRALLALPRSVREAVMLLKEFRPDLVLGVGGYASGPGILAAALLGIKRAIHEQNVIPGMANRMLKWFSHRIFISFEETRPYFPEKRTILTGNPVRKEILRYAGTRERGDQFTLLIFGGSTGAHRINMAMVEALGPLQEMRSLLRFVHQTGKDDLNVVSEAYEKGGFDAEVLPFIEKMEHYYPKADLIICRSGASTVAELAVCGKASILIPYPYAAHEHQRVNAQKLVDRGAARMILDNELNGWLLAEMIRDLYLHPEKREEMERAIRNLARPAAAEAIVDHCYRLARP